MTQDIDDALLFSDGALIEAKVNQNTRIVELPKGVSSFRFYSFAF